jgi:hypothetical protein
MNRYILLNHATGDFFEEYNKEKMEEVIRVQIEEGNDLDFLRLVYGKGVEIKEIPVFNCRYEINNPS